MTVVNMKLGDIEYRPALNPRGHVNMEAVQEYTRRLANGEIPPPLVVCAKTRVLNAGYQRRGAWLAHFGENWAEHEVPVILRDDLPDPNEEPGLFRLENIKDNINNGVRITRAQKRRIALELAEQYGDDFALDQAEALGETKATLKMLMDAFRNVSASYAMAMQDMPIVEASDGGSSRSEKGAAPKAPPSTATRYEPAGAPIGKLQRHVPEIPDACRKLRGALESTGTLTELDREELALTLEAIQAALGEEEEVAV